jgi:lipopolysaccharide export LptBFGC system permease protein LptF
MSARYSLVGQLDDHNRQRKEPRAFYELSVYRTWFFSLLALNLAFIVAGFIFFSLRSLKDNSRALDLVPESKPKR